MIHPDYDVHVDVHVARDSDVADGELRLDQLGANFGDFQEAGFVNFQGLREPNLRHHPDDDADDDGMPDPTNHSVVKFKLFFILPLFISGAP